MEDKKFTNNRFNINIKTKIEKIIKRIQNDDDADDKLVIPEYQRDYVWNEIKNIPELLTSLYIGYPIGFITLWDNHENDQLQLIDGLQRYYSIYKIYEKPFNFLHYKMFEFWSIKNQINLNEKIDKENFRHFKSNLNHKNNNYRKSTIDSIKKWINATNRLNGEYKNHYKNFINDYNNWFENDFKQIVVPHNILKDFKFNEVSEIFKIMNTTGKKLNNFEVASAKWSNYKIIINKKIKFINTFINDRIERYKNNFLKPENISESLIKYDSINIIPSNFIYAILEEILKNKPEFFYSFYDKNSILKSKSIEAGAEIIKEALIKNYELEKFKIDELGYFLSEKIKSEDDVNKLKDTISKSFDILLNDIKFLQFAKTNDVTKNITYSAWLITAFLILIIKGAKPYERKNFSRWFIYEFLIWNNYSSATGNYVKNNMEKYKLELSIDNKLINDETLLEKINEKILNPEINENERKFLLCLIQHNNYEPAKCYHIDHLIPQSKLKLNNEIKYNSIFNLQYLNANINSNEKKDILEENQIKWDVFEDDFKNNSKNEEYKTLIKKMISEIKNYKKISKDTFDKFLELRKEIMIKKINSKKWL